MVFDHFSKTEYIRYLVCLDYSCQHWNVLLVLRYYRRYTGRGLFLNQIEFLSFLGLGIVNARCHVN